MADTDTQNSSGDIFAQRAQALSSAPDVSTSPPPASSGGGDIFAQRAQALRSNQPPAPVETGTQPVQPQANPAVPRQADTASWYKKAWDWANSPLIDTDHIKTWTGWEPSSGIGKGLMDLATGLTSPLSIALTLGTFGSGSLIESGGAAALRAAGLGASDIAEDSKGAQLFSKALKTGLDSNAALQKLTEAGVDVAKFADGLRKLDTAGLSTESLLNTGVIRRVGSSMIRAAGKSPAEAERIGRGVQALVNAGFTVQNAYGAVTTSPRVLDALKEGDYQTAERLAVDAIGGGAFAALGAHELFHEAGSLMDEVAVKSGLKVAPTEENQKLQNTFGKTRDAHVAATGQQTKLDELAWRKDPRFKGFGEDDLGRVRTLIEAGLDDRELAIRFNALAESAGSSRRLPVPGEAGVLAHLNALPALRQRFPSFDQLKQKYGVTSDLRRGGWISPDGEMIPLPRGGEHFAMLGLKPEQTNERAAFIKESSGTRWRYRMGRGGEEIVFSVPPFGVTEEQAARIRSAASFRNGTVLIEEGREGGNFQKIEFPTASKIDEALRSIGGVDFAPAAAEHMRKTGGFIWNPTTGRVAAGWALDVLPEKDRVLDHPVTEQDIRQYYKDNYALFQKHPELHIGGFENELNIAATGIDRTRVEKLARQLNQRSIANWVAIPDEGPAPEWAFVPTGGTGEKHPNWKKTTLEDRLALIQKPPRGSTTELLDKPLKVADKPTVERIGETLQNFVLGRSRLPALEMAASEPDEMLERAKNLGRAELARQLAEENSGRDWYGKDIAEQRQWLSQLHPELQTDDELWGFAQSLTAAASLGNDSPSTMKLFDEIYSEYKRTGRIPATRPNGEDWGGAHSNANRNVLMNLQAIVDNAGGDVRKAYRWMKEKHPVEELRKVKPNGHVAGKASDLRYGAYALSPKAGAFFLNMNGISTELTMDKWASRTWNRWMGTLIDRDGEVHEAPRSEGERRLATQAFDELRQEFGLTVREAQAVMWYYEQALWKAHGLNIDQGVSYGQAAREYVRGKLQPEGVGIGSEPAQELGKTATAGQSPGEAGGAAKEVSAEGAGGEEEGDTGFDPSELVALRRLDVEKKFEPEKAQATAWGQKIAQSQIDYEPRQGGTPGMIRVDEWGQRILDPLFKNNAWEAIALMPKHIPQVLDGLKLMEKNMEPYVPEAAVKLREYQRLFKTAAAESPNGGVAVVPYKDRYGEAIDPTAAAEERFHILQAELGGGKIAQHVDLMKLAQEPEMQTFGARLYQIGYSEITSDPRVYTLEAAAHIAVGDYHSVGGTVEQRASFLCKYFTAIAEKHGVKSLEQFEPLLDETSKLVFDRLIPHLREKEQINESLNQLDQRRAENLRGEPTPAGQGVPQRQDSAGTGPGRGAGAPQDRGRAEPAPDQLTLFGRRSVNTPRHSVQTTVPPQEFLRRVGADENSIIKSPVDQERVRQALEGHRSGQSEQIPPVELTLDHDGNVVGANGRHRALAAMQAGVDRIPVIVHRLLKPSDEIEQSLYAMRGKPVEPGKARFGMDHERIRELIDQHLVRQHYTPEEIDKLLDSYDYTKLTPAHRDLAKELRNYYSTTFERAQGAGALGDKQWIENYSTVMWGKDADHAGTRQLIHRAHGDGGFSVNTSMAMHRTFENSFQGQLLGKKLAVTDPIALAAHNRNIFERVISARNTLAEIMDKGYRASDGMPMIAASGTGHVVQDEDGHNVATMVNAKGMRSIRIADTVVASLKARGDFDRLVKEGKIIKFGTDGSGAQHYAWDTSGYREVPHSAMHKWSFASEDTAGHPVMVKADLRVHPETYDYISRRLGTDQSTLSQSPLGKGLLGVGREAKGILLFGSPFHVMQEGLRALMTGISPFSAKMWDPTDMVLMKGVEKGLTLGKDYRSIQDFQDNMPVGHSKVIEKIPGLRQAQDYLQHFLFDKYIPSLKARAFKTLFERYKSAYKDWTVDKAAEVAAADTNERFGGINYKRMGRAAATQDLFKVLALAPDWLESEIRFMARTFGEEGKIARRDVALMGLGLWGAARVLNYLTTGQPHFEAPFGVAVKDKNGREKVYSVRTLPTDMMHAISDPGQFLSGRIAPVLRAGVQTYTGRDEYGRRLPVNNIAVNLVRSAAPIPLQTAAKVATGATPDVSGPEQAARAAGLTVYPYKTEAQKLAGKIASDHSETGPVDPAKLRRHIAKIQIEDQLRSGKMNKQDFYQLIEQGQIDPKEAKQMIKNVQETEGMDPDLAGLYIRAARLQAPEFLQVWDAATNDEKVALSRLMGKKAKAYYKKAFTEMTPQERLADPTYRRLRAMFPQEPPV